MEQRFRQPLERADAELFGDAIAERTGHRPGIGVGRGPDVPPGRSEPLIDHRLLRRDLQPILPEPPPGSLRFIGPRKRLGGTPVRGCWRRRMLEGTCSRRVERSSAGRGCWRERSVHPTMVAATHRMIRGCMVVPFVVLERWMDENDYPAMPHNKRMRSRMMCWNGRAMISRNNTLTTQEIRIAAERCRWSRYRSLRP